MLKPASLRQALYDALPVLKNNPDMLRLFIDRGTISATLAASLSFENGYTLNVMVTDFHDALTLLLVPIGAWLRENQPDIMTTDEGRRNGFTYMVDINSDDSLDVSISLRLTERTRVEEIGQALHVTPLPEPPLPVPVDRPKQLYINGELVSQWDE